MLRPGRAPAAWRRRVRSRLGALCDEGQGRACQHGQAAVALLAGLALSGQPGGLVSAGADRLARTRIAGWRAGQAGSWAAAAAAALVAAQLAVLVNGFHLGRAIPASADRAAAPPAGAGRSRSSGGTT